MSFDFIPMTEEELNKVDLVDSGTYNFEVIKSTRETSKKGNPMAKLNIRYWDNAGNVHTLFDYLVFSKVGLNIRKVKHFCDAVGLSEQYKSGSLPEELGGYSGKFELGTQPPQPKPEGGFYPAKNIVIDYVMVDNAAAPVINNPVLGKHAEFDDDLPF